jgi:hypothetical protein
MFIVPLEYRRVGHAKHLNRLPMRIRGPAILQMADTAKPRAQASARCINRTLSAFSNLEVKPATIRTFLRRSGKRADHSDTTVDARPHYRAVFLKAIQYTR